jgi:hypothetical protein
VRNVSFIHLKDCPLYNGVGGNLCDLLTTANRNPIILLGPPVKLVMQRDLWGENSELQVSSNYVTRIHSRCPNSICRGSRQKFATNRSR